MFSALAIVVVVYVVISTIVVMTLSLPAMDVNQGHVLSEAGRRDPRARRLRGDRGGRAAGDRIGGERHHVRRRQPGLHGREGGELPSDFTRGVWRGGTVGLLVAATLTALFVVFFPLAAVGRWPAWRS